MAGEETITNQFDPEAGFANVVNAVNKLNPPVGTRPGLADWLHDYHRHKVDDIPGLTQQLNDSFPDVHFE